MSVQYLMRNYSRQESCHKTARDYYRERRRMLLGALNQIFTDTPLGNIMSKPLVTISTECSVKDDIETMQWNAVL